MTHSTCWLRTSFPWGRSTRNYPCLPGNAHLPWCLRCQADADTPISWALTMAQAVPDIGHTACLVHPTALLRPPVETDTDGNHCLQWAASPGFCFSL